MAEAGGGQMKENEQEHDNKQQPAKVVVGEKWTPVKNPVIVRTNTTNPLSNPQLLVLDKYMFRRVNRRHDDQYKCFTDKKHHCPSLLKMVPDPVTEEKSWFMTPHEDNDACIPHQAPGVWRQCGKEFRAEHRGDYMINKLGHVFKYIPYFKNMYDKVESPRTGQTQYKCLVCEVKMRVSLTYAYEVWSKRNEETKLFEIAKHLNKHLPPKEKREEIEALIPINIIRLEGRTPLRSQTDAVEVLSSLPTLVSSTGKFLSTLKDDLDYLYLQLPDQHFGRMKVFSCVNVKCKGLLRMISPEDGVVRWERTQHGPFGEPKIKGVKLSIECREANTKITVPLQSGQLDFFKYTLTTGRTEDDKIYITEEGDSDMKMYIADKKKYGTFYRCVNRTCHASLRVLVNFSHHVWERAHARMIDGGSLIPIQHTCSDVRCEARYEKFRSEKVENKLLDITDGKLLMEEGQASSQELEDPENGIDEEEELNEGDVSRAGIAEPDESRPAASSMTKRGRYEAEEEEGEVAEVGPTRIRPEEEFEPLFESPDFDCSQNSEEPKKKDVVCNMTFRQIVQIVDKYCHYNQKEEPGERAKYWEKFIKECKELNRIKKAWCNQRRLAGGEMQTSPIPGFENTIFWNESVGTLGWIPPYGGGNKMYKCKLMDCNKKVTSKFVGTCVEHSSNRCFSFTLILCSGQDVARIFMNSLVRAFDELVPLKWSDEQAVAAFPRKKDVGLNIQEIESILKFNMKLPGVEANEIEKEKWIVKAKEFYSAAQVAIFLTTSFRSEKYVLARDQLRIEHIGANFKNFLHMNGFDYELRNELDYMKYVGDKYGTDEKTASLNFRRMVKLARRDVHEESRRGKIISALTRLCFKKNCKIGAHWWHVYFAKFAKRLLEGLEKGKKGLKREDIYVGLAPADCTSILAGCHNILSRDPTSLGPYMIDHGYTSVNELHEEDFGYFFAKETEAECRVGEGVAIFGIVLMEADQMDDVGAINKLLPVFRKFKIDDLMDLRTLLLAKFEVMFYPKIAQMREGEGCLVLDEKALIGVQEDEDEDENEEEEEVEEKD